MLITNNLRRDFMSDQATKQTKVITVRMPDSLHEALKKEAQERNTSMNKLCIAKLRPPLATSDIATQSSENNGVNESAIDATPSFIPKIPR